MSLWGPDTLPRRTLPFQARGAVPLVLDTLSAFVWGVAVLLLAPTANKACTGGAACAFGMLTSTPAGDFFIPQDPLGCGELAGRTIASIVFCCLSM